MRKNYRAAQRLERAWGRVYKIEAHTRQGGICLYCKTPMPLVAATAEHRRPLSRGGATRQENIDAACRPCNQAKGSLTRSQFNRVIHEPDFSRDAWSLYLAAVEIRLKRRTALACRRLRSIIGVHR